jgi:hypothetical protein
MAKEDELFEGLQIMTPQELESSMSSGETNTQDEGSENSNPNGDGIEGNEGFITPINKTATNDDDTPSSSTSATTSTNEAIYQALIKEMVAAGTLTVEEGEDASELPGSLDTIKSLMEKTVDAKTNAKQEAWKNSLSKSKKRFFEIEDAFDDDDLAIQMTERLEFFDNLSAEQLSENPALQKQIYHQYLLGKGFTEAEAKEEVEDADSLAKLEDKANKALPALRKEANDYVEKARFAKTEAVETNKRQAAEKFENLIKAVETKESFIDGINLNKVAREKLKENITKPVHTDEQGRQYTSLMHKQKQNAAEFEMLINYYDTIGLFNMDKSGNFKPDISKLKAVAKTKAINEIDRVIAESDKRGVGRNTSVETSQSTNDLLNALSSAFGNK